MKKISLLQKSKVNIIACPRKMTTPVTVCNAVIISVSLEIIAMDRKNLPQRTHTTFMTQLHITLFHSKIIL